MKTICSIIVLIGCLLWGSCRKCDDNARAFRSKGKIGAADYRKCSCCGGYFISIDKVEYRFFELPEGSGIDLEKDARPIHVELNWQVQGSCGEEIIRIDAIRKARR